MRRVGLALALALIPGTAWTQKLDCRVERSVGLARDAHGWGPAPDAASPDFSLEPVAAADCANDDFTCQAANPNIRLTSRALGSDFIGCWRAPGIDSMSCPVFTSTLAVNFAKGVFAVLDDQGLVSTSDQGGGVMLRVGVCEPGT